MDDDEIFCCVYIYTNVESLPQKSILLRISKKIGGIVKTRVFACQMLLVFVLGRLKLEFAIYCRENVCVAWLIVRLCLFLSCNHIRVFYFSRV